jgi:hypothetical protein
LRGNSWRVQHTRTFMQIHAHTHTHTEVKHEAARQANAAQDILTQASKQAQMVCARDWCEGLVWERKRGVLCTSTTTCINTVRKSGSWRTCCAPTTAWVIQAFQLVVLASRSTILWKILSSDTSTLAEEVENARKMQVRQTAETRKR